ncbi:MAG TPA: oxidoreductase [Nevskiaceae bacterium]|nr:oxidoreductase [Nevskiaceae bacterium]
MAQWSAADIPDLSGRNAIVTGANGGLGYYTALELARAGARVTLACRSQRKGEEAMEHIRALVPGADIELMSIDMGDLASVRKFAGAWKRKKRKLHLLVNNAGIVAQPLSRTPQGFELQMGVNYFGPFALTGLLLPLIKSTPGARIVNVASVAHKFGWLPLDDVNWERRRYNEWLGYGQSKLAMLLWTYELQRRLKKSGARAIALAAHPGYAATNLVSSEMRLARHWLGRKALDLGNKLFAHSAHDGALCSLYAATAAAAKGGDYIGPGGLGEMRGPPKKVKSTRASHDAAAARKLWTLSEQLTGVDYL